MDSYIYMDNLATKIFNFLRNYNHDFQVGFDITAIDNLSCLSLFKDNS